MGDDDPKLDTLYCPKCGKLLIKAYLRGLILPIFELECAKCHEVMRYPAYELFKKLSPKKVLPKS